MSLFVVEPDDTVALLKKFNDRDSNSYGKVYTLLYKELYYYTGSLYRNTPVDPEDVIQDIFLEIWENRRLRFDTIRAVKSYIYVAIKNKSLLYHRHRKVVDKVNTLARRDDSWYVIQAAEAEIFSVLPAALDMLPREIARSLSLYLEGCDVKEIALRLGKQPSTIYNQQKRAIAILQAKLNKQDVIILLLL